MPTASEAFDRLRTVATGAGRNEDVRSGALVALGTLAFLVFVGIVYPAPLPILFLGIVLGSLSGLVAMGIVLVYRANRIINFAQGDLGGLAGVLCASLIVGWKWSFFPAFIAGLLFAFILGGLTDILWIRRFAKAPRLIVTVATIGMQQIFAGFQLALPKVFDFDVVPQPPLPFSVRFQWFPVTFNAGHVLILIVVPIAMVGLGAFFRYTRNGIAVRASAERADRAALLGIPVKRIQTLVWVLAGGLSGLGVLLRLPIQGVSIGNVLGPTLMLRALAAAVIGRMENLRTTAIAALVLGMVEQAVLFVSGRTIIVDAVLFFVILGALLFQRGRADRAEETGAATWRTIREVRPIPRELMRVPLVRWGVYAAGVVVGAGLLFVPLVMSQSRVNLLGAGLIFAMAIVSLVILTGMAGQISLGQLAFVAFGAAAAGTLAQRGWDFFLTLLVAGLVGAVVAVVVGVPALRIRGLFLAVTTLAFAVTTGSYFLNEEFFPWLVPDEAVRIIRPVVFKKFDLESEHAYYYVILLVFALVVGSLWSLRNSRTGRALVATRDNQRAAESYGINPTRVKFTAFALSGFMAALAGGVFVYHQHGISSTVLESESNLRIFSMAVIGGLGSVWGAIFGATYQILLEFSPLTRVPETRLLSSGAGLLLILQILPSGLGGLLYGIRDAILRAVARARSIVVPSLLADVRVLEEEGARASGTGDAVGSPGVHTEVGEDAVLVVRDLDVGYGKTQVLFGANLHVDRGEIVALLGTNGAGKSTLLNAIAGLLPPSGGTVIFDGEQLRKWGPNETVAKGLVLMPGAKGVFPTLTVEENLRLAGWLYKKEPDHVRQATEQILEYFPILRERWKAKAGNLSGGEQQMLTLGQVLIARPKLLMIDELSLGLAPIVVERLLEIVRAIHRSGTAVVLVEQSVNIAITLAERAIFLEKGEVRFEGPTAGLLERPDILRAVFLGAATSDGDRRQRRASGATRAKPADEREPVLAATDLAVSFGGVNAVRDVDLDVRPGRILGIIGPNGAGKTTVFDLISGFLTPSSGRITIDGTDVTDLGADGRAGLGLGRSFQDAQLFPSMTVRQAIGVALERHIPVRDPLAAAVMSQAVRASEKLVDAEVVRLIELMNLQAFADKFVGELSTGTRRIVDLACSLAHDPKVLLLDEPSSGLAQRETEALGSVLTDLRDRTGAALVVIEHDMPLITAMSDELLALELGTVVVRGDPQDVINHPAVIEGYLGSTEDVILRSGRQGRARTGAKR